MKKKAPNGRIQGGFLVLRRCTVIDSSACTVRTLCAVFYPLSRGRTDNLLVNCGVSPQFIVAGLKLGYNLGMKKAIIRIQKLKSSHSVRRSIDHTLREKETPNADSEKLAQNSFSEKSTAEAMAKFDSMMPDKIRKNAVLCVEFLVTASPEAMAGKTRAEQDAYFRDAFGFIAEKHGKQNILMAAIHRDETTPHAVMYVVPKDERGKLNCRAFFGEKNALTKLQDEFSEQVGAKHGLERGQKRSKARHTTIREYYTKANDFERTVGALKAELTKQAQEIKNMSLQKAVEIVKKEQERRAKNQGQDR